MTRFLLMAAWSLAVGIAGFGALLLQGGDVAPVAAAGIAARPAEGPAPVAAAVSPVPVIAPGPVVPAPLEVQPPANAARESGAVLYGTITGHGGALLPSAYVSLTREGEAKAAAQIGVRDKRPEYAVGGLAAGTWSFRARADGCVEQQGTFEIPIGAQHVRRDFVLEPAWILKVKVLTPEGAPISEELSGLAKTRPGTMFLEVAVVVTPSQPAGDFPPTGLREVPFGVGRWSPARGIGAFGRGPQLPKDVHGTVQIDERQPVWASAVLRHRVLASVPVDAGQEEVTIVLPLQRVLQELGSIRGRIVDAATGAPLAGVRVGFGDLQSGGGGKEVDAQGVFEAKDLRPGLLTIEAYAKDRTAPRCLVELRPGQALDLGDVPMSASRTIEVRCEGTVGDATKLRLEYLPLDPTPHPAMQRKWDSAQVAADGTFKLWFVDGRYRLRASGAGACCVEVDTRTLGQQPLVLHLSAEALLRLDVQGKGATWRLALFDGGGREVWKRDVQSGWKFPIGLPAGEYRAEITGADGQTQPRAIHLGAGGADLRIP